ncbi:MAG: 8-amino-7-oxononanoate synthase [Gammaproteobacteria bacterium]
MNGEWSAQLALLQEQGLYRTRRVMESPQGAMVRCEGRELLNFCSNDYLGLANHPEVVTAFKNAADRYGVGSGSAHLICGHGTAHHALEEELAAFAGRERALLFSTGYMANVGVISALLGRRDAAFEDRLNHASLLDGGMLSGAVFKRYRHADGNHLSALLQQYDGKQCCIVSDGVFSMDGDLAPLPELAAIARRHRAWLMVDDAHGFGVLGADGGGVVQHFGLDQDDVPLLIGTLGKAFGTFGAFAAGSRDLIDILVQKARTYIYTTALPPAVAEATRAALRIVVAERWRREKLRALAVRFTQGAAQLGLPLLPSQSAIQPLLVGDSRRALQYGAALLNRGLLVGAIRPPTVPPGSARLRITFSALHQEAHVDRLLDALGAVMR